MIDRNTDIIQRTRTHLALCAPELSEHDRALIVRSHALLFVKVAIDRFWFYRASPDAVRERVQISNLELIKRPKQSPLILVCPHFLALEAVACRLAVEISTNVLYRPRDNPAVERILRSTFDRFNTQRFVPIDGSMISIARQLKSGTPLFICPDANIEESKSGV
ncbi:MAG: lysophospholipid acyltransferase family protein, partial [Casimicrobium sp.]